MRYTLTSWDNRNPEHVADLGRAMALAEARARREGSLVHLTDTETQMTRDVAPDGSWGKLWHDSSPYTERDALDDAIDEIEGAQE